MRVTWFDAKVRLPLDEQECLLMPLDNGGMCTVGVFGPIMWSAKNNCWLDIFRTPEAGTVVSPDKVGLWCDWDSIAPENQE